MKVEHALEISGIAKTYRVPPRRPDASLVADLRGWKQFQTVEALRGVSFAVRRGEVLGIIGANGAGKTTLLRVLARVTAPTAGKALIRGRVCSLLELGTGMQKDLTAAENVRIQGSFYRIPRAEIEAVLPEIIRFAELERFVDLPVKHYSSGMYLRLAFSTAINMKPQVILADEVLAVGDLAFQDKCMTRLAGIGQAGVTVLFVSHDMAAVRRLCTRCLWLDNGKIRKDGAPDEVVECYEQFSRNLAATAENAPSTGSGDVDPVQLLSLALDPGPGGAGASSVSASESLGIRARLKVARGSGRLHFRINLLCGNSSVFRSGLPNLVPVEEAGCYEALVRIPPDLLADREYVVKAGAEWFCEGRQQSFLWKRALAFRVVSGNAVDNETELWTQSRSSLIHPHLKWEFLKREEPAISSAGI